MTPYTASLLYRCQVRNAASYTLFITETNDITLKLWQNDYHTGDIKRWARGHIDNLLAKASDLRPLLANDESICLNVQNAVRDSLEALEKAGCLSGNVAIPGVGIMKTDDGCEQLALDNGRKM